MKILPVHSLGFLTMAALVGCSTTSPDNTERGREGTIAYHVQIESSEPGARLEANNDYVGKTPLTLTIFGDKNGTFHNFGSSDYIIKVYPVRPGQYIQTKIFRTGGYWSQEDKIPGRLYFDLDQKSEGFSIDLPSTKTNP